MENLKKIVSNQYFPAAAVLTVVVLFWTIAMFGGLSLLHNNQPPMATLTWLLFVYGAAVLTPLAGIIAAADLVRRWRRNRHYAVAQMSDAAPAQDWDAQDEPVQVWDAQDEPVQNEEARTGPARPAAPAQPAQHRPATRQPARKQPGQSKQRKTAA